MRLSVGGAFFPHRIRNTVARSVIAIVPMAMVIVLTFLFARPLGNAIPAALVFFAIGVSSWYAGRGAGLTAAILGLIATDVIVAPSAHPLTNVYLYSRLFAFTLFALMIAALRDAGDRYRRDQDRLLELERAARAAAEQSAGVHKQVEDRLTVLVEASGALLTSLESASVLTRIMEMAKQFVAADAYAIWRRNGTGKWEVLSAEGLSDQYKNRFFAGMQEIGVEGREVVAVGDVQADARFQSRREVYKSENIRSLLMISLPMRDEAPGAISFYYRTQHDFGTGDVRVATALANLAGSALLLAELYEEQIRLRADAQDVTDALQHSNQELQQFAYVVSHDLQEPLRMVSSYAKLLAKRYGGKLDQDADDFIGFMIGGVDRMQTLIRDLLAYSRVVNSGAGPHEYVPLKPVLDDVLMNLRSTIERESAVITYEDGLPAVLTGRTLLTQLFQNLISNALKYRRDEPPQIHVGAENHGKEWVFSVRDNGIGLEERNFERIFGIFKRLHGPEYTGTGIGLAIAKRIVERHRGRIWVESKLGEGSIFYVSLPAEIVHAG